MSTPVLIQRLREATAEWPGSIVTDAADALEQLQAERRLSLEEQSQLKHYPELLQQYVVERDLARKAEAERDALATQVEQLQAECLTAAKAQLRMASVTSDIVAERDALRAKCERYEKALNKLVAGYAASEEHVIAIAREALAEDK